jgi:micrococcal nuclease|tara:strand:+ start:49 stop:465 length:417 start_codon:yes stop_codon:yes gene_type:complete
MYHYPCKIIKVVDGDTVDVDIDLGFGVWMKNQRIRMYGIDAPESRTSNQTEKRYGVASKRFLEGMCDDKNGLVLRTHKDKKGKFGRILGELWRTTDYADQSINEYMIEKYHAVRYMGQSKDDIRDEHIKNRLKVTLDE